MALAPDWLRAVFNGNWGDPEVLIGTGITAVLAVIAVRVAGRSFSRANA
jgi:hypothetical protein